MHKKEIIIDGVDVSKCEFYDKDKKYCLVLKMYPKGFSNPSCFSGDFQECIQSSKTCPYTFCHNNPDCYFKQLQKEKFENLNNRQMVESAENLIYENSELCKNLKEKEQECEELKRKVELMMDCPDCKVDEYKKALDEIEKYVNNQGIDHKWNMYIQRFKSGILDIITKTKDDSYDQ